MRKVAEENRNIAIDQSLEKLGVVRNRSSLATTNMAPVSPGMPERLVEFDAFDFSARLVFREAAYNRPCTLGNEAVDRGLLGLDAEALVRGAGAKVGHNFGGIGCHLYHVTKP